MPSRSASSTEHLLFPVTDVEAPSLPRYRKCHTAPGRDRHTLPLGPAAQPALHFRFNPRVGLLRANGANHQVSGGPRRTGKMSWLSAAAGGMDRLLVLV